MIIMNSSTFICIIFAMIFLILACIFVLLKSKGAMIISGFNTLPKEQRKLYNQYKMSIDYRNLFALWSSLFFTGAMLSQLVSGYLTIIVFIIWIIPIFKNMGLDANKTFEKYKIKK